MLLRGDAGFRKLTIDADDDVITATVVETHFGDTFKFTAKDPTSGIRSLSLRRWWQKVPNVMKLQRSYTSSAIVTKLYAASSEHLSDSDREAIFVREIYYDRVINECILLPTPLSLLTKFTFNVLVARRPRWRSST